MSKVKLQTAMTPENFQQIAGKPLPTAEELFIPLNKWHSLLYDAFGSSLPRSRDVLKNTHSKAASKWFRPQIIRFYVHDFLNQKGIKAQLVDDNDDSENNDLVFEPRVLAGNGIAGNINGFEYRILKIFRGGLPPPVTEKRKEYYNQPHLEGYQSAFPGLPNDLSYRHLMKPNLVYLWELDKKNVNLYMAIPKHSHLYAETKLTLIPNPITAMKQTQTEEAETEKQMTEVEKKK
jgi:hypothetical protein